LDRAASGPHSRERVFSLRRTFWAFLWQVLNPGSPCREVVRQTQALLARLDFPDLDENSSAYCQARLRLPPETLQRVFDATVQTAARLCPSADLFHGQEVKVVDGTTVSLEDTPENQQVYPQPRSQKPGCGFPLLKLVALFSLATGAVLTIVHGGFRDGELTLFRQLWLALKAGDLLLADRGFSDYATLAGLWLRGVDGLFRLHASRPSDFRRGTRLGRNDRLVTWTKPKTRLLSVDPATWAALPQELLVRQVGFTIVARGFRTRKIILVTTLLDPEKHPAQELAELYARRWNIELYFRHIKTSMKMETLRCKTPAMVQKEILMHLTAYNLIRCLMLEAGAVYGVSVARISFKGSVDAVRQYSAELMRARSRKQKTALYQDLLEALARDLVPERPNRSEPRAVKRRPKPYPVLNKPRRQFKEIPHRSRYRKSKGLI
jgi:hypothetical protein